MTKELQHLSGFLCSIASHDLSDILEDLLTPQEIIELSERLRILQSLHQEKTQRNIAEEIGVSIGTVSRWSKILQFGTQTIKKYL